MWGMSKRVERSLANCRRKAVCPAGGAAGVEAGRWCVVCYVSGHGWGHAVRTADWVRALGERLGEGKGRVRLVVASGQGRGFWAGRGVGWVEAREGRFDVGMAQRDSVRGDVEETWRRLVEMRRGWEASVERERAFLREVGADLVVSDVVGVAFEAAARAGVPAVGFGNFDWEWIYRKMGERDGRFAEAAGWYREAYASAAEWAVLPFSPGDWRPGRVGLRPGLLARPGRNRREEVARRLGLDPGKRWALAAFTGLAWERGAAEGLESMRGWEVLGAAPLEMPGARNARLAAAGEWAFDDLVATCDVAVGKPGYGLVSSCAANGTPLVYAGREEFPEYFPLRDHIRRTLRNAFLEERALYRGEWGAAVAEALADAGAKEPVRGGGAEEVAGWVAGWAEGQPRG